MKNVLSFLNFLVFSFALASCTTLPSAPSTEPPSEKVEAPAAEEVATKPPTTPSLPTLPSAVTPTAPKPSILEATCPAPDTHHAVDLSEAATPRFLETYKYLCGGKRRCTVIRYGDYTGARDSAGRCLTVCETIRGKVPKADELARIKAAGMDFLPVFQHNNSKFASFTAARGKADAEQMQKLYPWARSWYYGVDFDASSAEQPKVEEYARAFKKVADVYGKKIGAYGSGRTLTNLFGKGLIDYKWISMSTGFGGTRDLTASGKFHLLQKIDKNCGGTNVDFNMVKEPDFGQTRL